MKPDAIKPIVARIAALLESRQIDEAEALLNDPRLRGESVSNVEVIRLRQRLATLKQEIATQEVDDALERALADVIDEDDDR
jgi:hypothetical protein